MEYKNDQPDPTIASALREETLGEMLFRYRDYTPIPLILLLLIFGDPSVPSATFGTLCLVVGELFRLYTVGFIGGVSRTRSQSLGASLVTEGPFSYVRNPLYVGNFILVLGFSIYGGVFWVGLLAVAGFAWQYHHIVKFEEELLEREFGDPYRSYRERVPAWLPKACPKWSELPPWPAGLMEALPGERKTLLAIGVVLFLLMLIGRN